MRSERTGRARNGHTGLIRLREVDLVHWLVHPSIRPCEAAVEARQYNVHEAKTHLSRILEQVATGEEVVISKAGEPVAKVVPLHPRVRRTGRGSLSGQIHIKDDFDDLPDDLADAFGMR